MPKLEISLLGSFQVLLGGVPVTQFESVKARALLAYLASEIIRPRPREHLAALLWPEWPQQSAMTNLRHALADLRKVIGDRNAKPPFLFITRNSLQLNREAEVQVDVIEFEQDIGDRGQGTQISDLQASINNRRMLASAQSAIALYRGPFLEGFSLPDSAPFDEWLLAKREYFNQQMLTALGWLAEWGLAQGEYEQAEGYARRQIELESWREQAYQQLMRALYRKGKRVQALAQFESLKKALQRELKVEPSEDTIELYQQIREGILPTHKEETTAPIETATISVASSLPEVIKPRHNLPLQLTSFIGREKEIEAVRHLLQNNRLVTLTGSGGVGKTRLALQTAAWLVDQYADGVWLVELAPLSDPGLVPTLAARAMGLRELTGSQMISLLEEYLEPLQVLLILDNCEHVIEACASLANTLLQTCPRLTLLASSREALGIPGEMPFRVPPLSMPETPQSMPLKKIGEYEAIRLFVERATTFSPGFTLTPPNVPIVFQICQHLAGIPLAIELAAARIKLLQVGEIAQRLDDRFRLLTGGSRAALPRHQTLRASIDWSYDLLPELERRLLQRLSVFAGGWVLKAAEVVGCDDRTKGEGIQSGDVLELLGQLVDKSLVNPDAGSGGETCYRMLETIRQYAHEKLVESGQAEAVRDRHLQYYLDLAERVGEKIRGPDQAKILDRLSAELDNLRLALDWSLEGRGRPGWNPEPGLRLAAELMWFWNAQGRHEEAIQWLEHLLAGEAEERGDRPLTPERTRCRARALTVLAYMADCICEFDKSFKAGAESRELYQSLGAKGRVGYALACYQSNPSKNPAENRRIQEQALAVLRETGDRFWVSAFLVSLGHIALETHDYERAKTCWDEALALRKEIGDPEGLASAIGLQSQLANYMGNVKQARALVKEAVEILSAIHSTFLLGQYYEVLSDYDKMEGNYKQAAIQIHEALSIGRRQGDILVIFNGLAALGQLALLQGNYQEAAERYEEYLAYARKKDNKVFIYKAQSYLGDIAWECGDFEQARHRYTEALNLSPDFGYGPDWYALDGLGKVALARGEMAQAAAYLRQVLDTPNLIPDGVLLERVGLIAAALGKIEDACRLMGSTDAWYIRYYHIIPPRRRHEREACVTALRVGMGEQAFTAAFAEGQAITQEQAIRLAKAIVNT